MAYPSLVDLRGRPDAAGLSDEALRDGLAVAVETVELYCRRGFGDSVDPTTGTVVVPVATPAGIRLVVAGLAVYIAGQLWSRVPDRATSITTDMGVVQLSQPDSAKGRPTGIPDFDAVLNSYKIPLPEIG